MRASKAPDKWKLVLDALNKNDYELANKLAIKYKFVSKTHEEKIVTIDDIRHTPLKGDYVAMDPDGKMYCHEFAARLSTYLGLSHSYVATSIGRLEANGGVSRAGKVKGWKFWKEEL